MMGEEKSANIILSLEVSPAEKGSGVTIINNVSVVEKGVGKGKKQGTAKSPQEHQAEQWAEQWWVDEITSAITESSTTGIILGYPVIDIQVCIQSIQVEGILSVGNVMMKYCAAQALHIALKNASPIKLEPIMRLIITAPREFIGDAMHTISSRKGIVHNVENQGASDSINAEVPMSEMFGYSTALRNATQGRAAFTLSFSHYAEVSY